MIVVAAVAGIVSTVLALVALAHVGVLARQADRPSLPVREAGR